MKNKVEVVRIEPQINLDKIKRFVQDVVMPKAHLNDESGKFDFETVNQMYELGVLNLIIPTQYGGSDSPVSDLVWVARSLAYGSAGVAATFIGNLLGLSALVLYGNVELKRKICSDFQKNYGLWSFGMTEKGCGSDLEKTSTMAVKTKDGYIINGEKNFITNATYATHFSVFAQTFDETGKKIGISCFYIPGDSSGVTRGDGEKKLGWRESNTGHLFLKNVFIPSEYLLGVEGKGLRVLTHCLNRSKTLLGAVGVGICDRAMDLTKTRLLETHRYDRPLIEKSAIKHLLARLIVEVESAWLLTCKAAAVWDAGGSAVKEASMAKLAGGAIASKLTYNCTELFGARGYLSSYEINRLYRDAKAIEIVEGPTLVQELLIAKHCLESEKVEKSIFSAEIYNPEQKLNVA